MKIQCPACSASYLVPDTAIGPVGRKVKCASCGNQWHQEPLANPSVAPTTHIEPPQDTGMKAAHPTVPAVREALPASASLKRLAAACIVLAVAAQSLPSFASWFGATPMDGLVLDNLTAKVQREENHLVTYIDGIVRNESESDVYRPGELHVKVLSGQKRVMAETTYKIEAEELAPGESVPLTPKIGNISGNARYLVIDIGDGFERSFRE